MLRIMNRGWMSNPIAVLPDDPASLWPQVFRTAPVENSIIVFNDGTVREGNNFPPWVYDTPDVFVMIWGGTRYPVTEGSWLAGVLEAAGYVLESDQIDVYEATYSAEYE